MRIANDDPLLGMMVGSHRIARLIERGGMGIVYKAVHREIGSPVAIKVLSDECANRPDLVARFFDEARAVNVARHDNIVRIHHLDQLMDGRPYIIMEFIEGEPLSIVVKRHGQLPLGSTANLLNEVLAGLGAAHNKNIVHRDLKPENILVTPSGHAKILDFGVAKLKGFSNVRTATGAILGTPYYMSPEQAQAQEIDGRSDLYSVGVMLFECVTGDKPFKAKSPYGVRTMHIEATPPKPSERRADLPADYEAVILRALEKDPADRFQTTEEFTGALKAASQNLSKEEWDPLVTSPEAAPPVITAPIAVTHPHISDDEAKTTVDVRRAPPRDDEPTLRRVEEAPDTIQDIPRQEATPAEPVIKPLQPAPTAATVPDAQAKLQTEKTPRLGAPRSSIRLVKAWPWLVVATILLGLILYAALTGPSKNESEPLKDGSSKATPESHNVLVVGRQ